MKTSKRFFSTVLFLFVVSTLAFAQLSPEVLAGGYEALLRFGESVPVEIKASDVLEAAKMNQRGVLFISEAVPEDKALESQPITLTYSGIQNNDGSRLAISFGNKTIIANDLFDWMLLPLAMYVDSEFNNCVTLFGNPKNRKLDDGITSERDRTAFDNVKALEYGKKSLFLAEFHPALKDNLVGLVLFLVDAMVLESDLRTITSNMGTVNGFTNRITFDQKNSELSAKKLSSLLRTDEAQSRLFADKSTELTRELINEFNSAGVSVSNETFNFIKNNWFNKPYHSYIFSEPNGGISFRIENDQIKFTGVPYYQFLKITNRSLVDAYLNGRQNIVYENVDELTNTIRSDPNLIRNLNPAIFDTVTRIAQWSGLLRYVRVKYPNSWNNFINQLKESSVAYSTPVNDSEFLQYHYKIDPAYKCRTPRSLDLLQKRFGETIEDEYAEFVKGRNQKLVEQPRQIDRGKELNEKIISDGKPIDILLDYLGKGLEQMENISHFQILDNGVLLIGEKSSSPYESSEKVEWIKTAINTIIYYPNRSYVKEMELLLEKPSKLPFGRLLSISSDLLKKTSELYRLSPEEFLEQSGLPSDLSKLSTDELLKRSKKWLSELKQGPVISIDPPKDFNKTFQEATQKVKDEKLNDITDINSLFLMQNVRFMGGIENTDYGYILFEADRLMKGLACGRDNENKNITFSSDNININGYKNIFELKEISRGEQLGLSPEEFSELPEETISQLLLAKQLGLSPEEFSKLSEEAISLLLLERQVGLVMEKLSELPQEAIALLLLPKLFGLSLEEFSELPEESISQLSSMLSGLSLEEIAILSETTILQLAFEGLLSELSNQGGINTRFWFTPEYELFSEDKTFYLRVDVKLNSQATYSGKVSDDPVSEQFAYTFNTNYTLFSREFPVYKKLRQIAEITCIIQVIKLIGVDTDKYRSIPVSKKETPVKTPTVYNNYLKLDQVIGHIAGGVDFSQPPKINNSLDIVHKNLVSTANNVPLNTALNNYVWEFIFNGKAHVATYLPLKLNPTLKLDSRAMLEYIGK